MTISAGNADVLVPVFQPGDEQHRRRIATWALHVNQDLAGFHSSVSNVAATVNQLSANAVLVAMGANTVSTQTITAGSTNRIVTWQTEFDTHSAFNASAGVYTVPVNGLYRVQATFLFNNIANPVNVARIYKNSATNVVSMLSQVQTGGTANYCTVQPFCLVSCSVGDTITVSLYSGSTNTLYNGGSASADARTYNKLYIERVK